MDSIYLNCGMKKFSKCRDGHDSYLEIFWFYENLFKSNYNSTTKVNNMQVSKILILFTGLSAELMEIALNSLRKDKCCFYIVYSKVDD